MYNGGTYVSFYGGLHEKNTEQSNQICFLAVFLFHHDYGCFVWAFYATGD